jgi:ATP-dependent protease ClpP protease subunit
MKPGTLEARVEVQKGQRIAVLNFSGTIGLPFGFNAQHFIESLTSLGEHDVLYAVLDSSGGSPVDAWIIFDFLKKATPRRYRSLVLITGECSGDALLVALGFDQILMRQDALIGFQPTELSSLAATRQATKLMARLIARRSRCHVEDVLAWMDKNRRFTAEECLARSLCDAII